MCRDNLLTEISNEELEAFLARLKPQVAENEYKIAESLVHTLQELGDAHQQSRTRVRALLKQIYGEFSSEKMEQKPETEAERPSGESRNSVPPKKQKPREGGLRAADDFHGAKREQILFGPDQKPNLCPNCQGKIHKTESRQLIRYYAAPPVNATIYSVERLRCRHCETIVEAEIPKEVGTEKYDSTVIAWLGHSRYRMGVPMYRLALSQELLGVPLPVQTQYMHLKNGAELLRGIFEQMELEAASSSVFISDDTPNTILKMLLREDENGKIRTGVYTSAIHAILENNISIQLYFTGNRHQGENMGELLRQRTAHTKKPLHMTDGSSHGKPKLLNTADSLEKAEYLFVNAARCLVHARRRFFKIREDYKEACDYLLGLFGKIFGIEAELLRNRAGPEERVKRHSQDSGPLMEEILRYCQDNLAKKDVEPNSSLGKAMTYFIEDYEALSLFLHDPRSPLHTNSAERMIKDVARHRKNSLFFRTLQGAKVGDIWLSVIKTCEANKINPWEYLKDLFQKNTVETLMPEHWLPWVWAARQKNTSQAKS
jgi:hypothetical protein